MAQPPDLPDVPRPEQPFQTDYSTYLFIDALLQLQQPLTEGAPDEMLFIVAHQVYELWFKLVLHELEGARDRLIAGEPWSATRRVHRAVAVEELLVEQLRILETMSPEGFFEFRDPLAPASGFQSVQFREIEALSGGFGASPGAVAIHDDETRARLAQREREPTLWGATLTALEEHGLLPSDEGERSGEPGRTAEGEPGRTAEGEPGRTAEGEPGRTAEGEPGRTAEGEPGRTAEGERSGDAVLAAVLSIYRNHEGPLRASFHGLFEQLMDHDEVIARWRYHHMLMASREIGGRPGTGGSLGVEYLRRTLDKRFFPVLWEVRSRL